MEDWQSLTKGKSFITDLGESKEHETKDGKTVLMGRYAVWIPIPFSEKHGIAETGNNLNLLRKKYKIESKDIFKVNKSNTNNNG